MNLVTQTFRGNRTAIAHINKALWKKLSLADRQQVRLAVSSTASDSPLLRGRSLIYGLKKPVVDSGGILSLRFKGIAPKVLEDGTIPEHRGRGAVQAYFKAREDGTVFREELVRGEPEGGAYRSNSEREFQVASTLAQEITDDPFGWGFYPEIVHNNENLGFVIYGQKSVRDLRFWQDYVAPLEHKYDPEKDDMSEFFGGRDFQRIAYLFGKRLAAFHVSYIHRYPGLGNLGVIMEEGAPLDVRIRDLDNCLPISDLKPPQAYSYLFLDLARIFRDFSTNWTRYSKDTMRPFSYNLAHLLSYFFRGYFGDDVEFKIDNRYYRAFDSDYLTDEEKMLFFIGERIQLLSHGREVNLFRLFGDRPARFSSFIALMHERFSMILGLPLQPSEIIPKAFRYYLEKQTNRNKKGGEYEKIIHWKY